MEAIIGTIDVAVVLFLVMGANTWRRIGNMTLYVVATMLAGIFVISSELNWITFRGPNVYDPNDIVASVLGLFIVLILLTRFGLVVAEEP